MKDGALHVLRWYLFAVGQDHDFLQTAGYVQIPGLVKAHSVA